MAIFKSSLISVRLYLPHAGLTQLAVPLGLYLDQCSYIGVCLAGADVAVAADDDDKDEIDGVNDG